MAGLALMSHTSDAADLNTYGTTLLRYEDHSIGGFGKQRTAVGTQYIGMDLDKLGNGNLSLSLYGWGRGDFSGESAPTGDSNANFTYGYLRYRFPDTSSELTAGRFFVYGRGISSYIDGVSARSDLSLLDLPGGVGLQVFTGTPVKTDHVRDNRGDFLTGGRVSYRLPGLLEFGAASLYESGLAANGSATALEDYRNILVGDVWFSPYRIVEVTGHTSYNTVTRGVAENRYLISLKPAEKLFTTLEYNYSTFRDLFSSSSQRNLFNPDSGDKVTSYGGTASYAILPFLDLSADYRYSLRSGRAATSRVGGGAILRLADNRVRSGLSWHRYDVGQPTVLPEGFRVVSFSEVRGYVLYDNSVYTASIDTIADIYDRSVHGKDVGYEVAGSLGYRLMPNIKLSCDLSLADNPQFSNEIKGIARLVFSHGIVERPHLDYRSRHAGDEVSQKPQAKPVPAPATEELLPAATDETVRGALPESRAVEVPGEIPPTTSQPAEHPNITEQPAITAEKPKPVVEMSGKGEFYRIDVNDILASNSAARVVSLLKSSGCNNVRFQTVEKDLPMHRLFVSEVGTLSLAKKELAKLRKIAAGSFLLKSGSRYQLFAGSFRALKNAVAEHKRLAASHGVKIDIRDGIQISALLHSVSADVTDRPSGEGLVAQLKKRGFDAVLIENKPVAGSEPGRINDSDAAGDNDADKLQFNWMINELKRRGVDTSTIILDDETESNSEQDEQNALLLSAGITIYKTQAGEDLLSEVIR